jgi:hypothetical protein
LEVIAKTNEAANADRPTNAAVRVVGSLEVGPTAAKSSRSPNRIDLPAAVRAGAAGGEGLAPADGGRSSESPDMIGIDGGRGEGTVITPEMERVQLLSGRYLDANGQPIPFAGDSTDFRTPFGREYKRLPIRMVLQMDLKWLPQLITECANRPLPIEVQEVRWNPRESSDGGRMGGDFNVAPPGGRSAGFGGAFGQGEILTFNPTPNIGTVIIQGIIYIIFEPDEAALRPGDVVALSN